MAELTDQKLAAWRALLFTHARVIRALEADMLEQHGLAITWFDLLGRLRQSPDKKLRMHELERASLFTRSGITRLVDRLEEAGLVRRERSVDDRRGVYVAITPAGELRLDEVWTDHVASIQEHFGRFIDAKDAKALLAATKPVLDGLAVETTQARVQFGTEAGE